MKHLLLTASLSAMCLLFSLSANTQQLTSFYLQGQNLRSAELVISHDIDNDGNPDIITGNRSRIEPYRNLGNGQFERFESGLLSLTSIFVSDARSSYPGFTDFDSDGDEDVIISSLKLVQGTSLLETEFFYYENTGDTYVEQTTPFFSLNFNFFGGAHTFDLYDFDGDGDDDMIVANEMGDIFLLESKDGAFIIPSVNPFEDINPVGSDPRLVNVQVLVLDDGDSHSIVLLNRNNRTLRRYDRTISGYELIDEASDVYAQLDGLFTQLVLADLDADGLRDAWGYTSFSIESGQSLFMKRTGDSFDPFSTTKNPFNGWLTDGTEIAKVTSDIELADLNNNGQPELYALGRSGTPDYGKILKFNESGAREDATNPFISLSSTFISLELIDWDKDGDLDLFAGVGGSPSSIEYYRNDAGNYVQLTGTANPADGITVQFSPHVCVADFNGDDELDLILGYTINDDQDTDPSLLYFENESGILVSKSGAENPFAEATVGNLGRNMSYKPEAGDLNGDGKVDIIIGVPKSNGASGEVSFLLNNGSDTYQLFTTNRGPIASMEWPNGRLSASLYDIDQDGDLDIFGATRSGNILMVENEHQSYFVSVEGTLLVNNDFSVFADFGEIEGRGSIVREFVVKSSKPDFEITTVGILNLGSRDSNFKILSTNQTEPGGDYIISVEFNPVRVGTGVNERLEITTNQAGDEELFTVFIQGTSNGPSTTLYKSLGFGSIQPIQNGRFISENSRVNANQIYTLELMLANTGTDDLIIDISSLQLPEGVTLATATPLQGTVPITDPFLREGVPLSFQIEVGDEEPVFTGNITFESNDPFQNLFSFQIFISDVEGISSPGTIFVENILMKTDADPKEINAAIGRPSTVLPSFELLEGDDIITLSGSTVTPKGVIGQARLQATFPGDPANELLPDSSIFFVNVVENTSDEIQQVIEFEDFVMQLEDAPRLLPSFTNATGFSIGGGGISFEILSGESVIDIDPTLKVIPRNFGSAEVEVTYQASAPFTGPVSKTATIIVADPNNTAPVVVNPFDDLVLNEGFGDTGGTIDGVFSDVDGDDLTYTITSSDTEVIRAFFFDGNRFFVLDDAGNTGEVVITVTASDGKGGFTSDEFTVTVVPNQPPVIEDQTFTVEENTPNGSSFGQPIEASDPEGSILTYRIVSGNELNAFSLLPAPNAGVIRIDDSTPLDYELRQSIVLTIEVQDNRGNTSQADVTIRITNVDETGNDAPELIALNYLVDENAANATKVGDIQGSDIDGDPITYTIISGNTDNAFALNRSSGELTVNNPLALNFEVNPSFELLVEVSDGEFAVREIMSVTIVDQNEPPTIENQTFTISEESANATLVGQVVASDPEGDDLSFEIVSGNNNEVFTIDPSTGSLIVNNSRELDFETSPSFELVINVADNEFSMTATITVLLTDVEENSTPTISNAIADQSLSEGFGSTTIDLTSVFTDADSDVLTFSVAVANTGIVTASISGTTLTISEVAVGATDITVTADDDKGGSISDVFEITVSAASNTAPVVSNAISDQVLNEGFGTEMIDLTNVFTDADSDVLTLSVSVTNTGVVTASIAETTLTLTEVGTGTTEVTITADDGKGGVIDDVLEVIVNEEDQPLSIGELSDQVVIYPNPSSERLYIEAEGKNITLVKLLNASGQEVKIEVLRRDQKWEIGAQSLSPGLYTILYVIDNEKFSEIVIVK